MPVDLYRISCFRINITYIDKNGQSKPVRGKVGDNVMYRAYRYNIEPWDLEGKYLTILQIELNNTKGGKIRLCIDHADLFCKKVSYVYVKYTCRYK